MKIVACDPGESFGYCVGHDNSLEVAGTAELWDFVHALGDALLVEPLLDGDRGRSTGDSELTKQLRETEVVVIEDWTIYPWVAEKGGLNFDKCRTARAIGALEYICRAAGTRYHFQPAKIKETAQTAGVEELYLSPRHENRHANDAMQHFVYYNLTEGGGKAVTWAKSGAAA